MPELPVYTINLAIPDGADRVWLENVNITYSEPVSCGNLYPYQEIPETGDYTFTMDSRYYTYSGFDYFGDAVRVSEPYMYYGVRGVTVSIMPVQNNPAQNTVRTLENITFEVVVPEMSKMTNRPAKSGRFPTDLIDMNPDWWTTPTTPPVGPNVNLPQIWFLTSKKYAKTLDYYVKYKQHLDFITRVFYVEDIGNTPTAIRNFLRTEYNNTTFVRGAYLLIVGNKKDIPYSAGEADNKYNPPTDIYYSCLEKANISEETLTPEFPLGRWPVTNDKDLQNIIR